MVASPNADERPEPPAAAPASGVQPRLLLTMGDPLGVGPEVIAGVWSDCSLHTICRMAVVGEPAVLSRAIELRGLGAELVSIPGRESAINEAWEAAGPGRMPVVCPGREPIGVDACTSSPGQAAFDAIQLATRGCLAGHSEAMVTGPINKAHLNDAGHGYPGHTELLAEMCGVQDFAMMLYLPPGSAARGPHGLGVVHTTLHTPLRDVFSLLSVDAIAAKCRLADRALRRFGAPAPRVAVAALNPHAGEEGLFGGEERELIQPAVDRAAGEGLGVTGPWPVDTLMGRAAAGEFDAVVAMYHDQGHIALKLLGMHAAVNVTLGLPIVRTSVAHGTAPDLAWQGVAETAGMAAAIRAAVRLADPSNAS